MNESMFRDTDLRYCPPLLVKPMVATCYKEGLRILHSVLLFPVEANPLARLAGSDQRVSFYH